MKNTCAAASGYKPPTPTPSMKRLAVKITYRCSPCVKNAVLSAPHNAIADVTTMAFVTPIKSPNQPIVSMPTTFPIKTVARRTYSLFFEGKFCYYII